MKRSFRYLISLMIWILLLSGCSSQANEELNAGDSDVLEPTTVKATYTCDFDVDSNISVEFHGIALQIPQTWAVYEEDTVLHIDGPESSQLGNMWIEMMSEGISEEDLTVPECQEAIVSGYFTGLSENFDNVQTTTSFYNTEDQEFFALIEGELKEIPFSLGLYAFVESGNLYVFGVPYMEGDLYKYNLDINDVIRSVQSLNDDSVLPENSTFSIQFIDVGEADAALVECDGHYMLIDGGNKDDSSLIYSLLKERDITHLDIVVGTHAHEDHIGGLPGAFNYANSDLTLCPIDAYDSDAFSDFKRYAEEHGGGLTMNVN